MLFACACSQPAPAPKPNSVVILPIHAGASGEPIDWLCRALTVDLIDAAGTIPNLHVAGPVSTLATAGQKDPAAVLSVEAVLRTEIDEKGGVFKISLQLLRASNGEVLNKHVISRGSEEMIRVHHEIAKLLASWLSKEPPELPVKSGTADLDAHYLYWRGLSERYRPGGKLETALQFYQQAVQRDSYYAAAHARLAEARVAQLRTGTLSPDDVNKARTAARRAVELGEDSAIAHAALGSFLLWIDWKWAEASMQLREALDWQPSNAAANQDYAVLLTASRRFGDALTHINAASRIEPLDIPASQSNQWLRLYARGWSPDQARNVPRAPITLLSALSESFAGNHAKATELATTALQDGLESPFEILHLAHVWRSAGRQDRAAQLLEKLHGGGPLLQAAASALRTNDREDTIRQLRAAVDQHDPNVVYIHLLPMFDSLRNDSRFLEIASQIGLTADEKSSVE
ncbi:MAG: hypothetical protein U0R19_18425 [Bryobacteraceae bacterium]